MIARKCKVIDGKDREILRVLYIQKSLVTSEVAKHVGISCSAIKPRLNNLLELGIVKNNQHRRVRSYKRIINNKSLKINSPSKIIWELDLKK